MRVVVLGGLLQAALLLSHPVRGQDDFLLLRATGNRIDSLPEMVLVPDTAAVYQITRKAIANSFMGEAIRLYHIAQRYLINQGKLVTPEPAYLAITTNKGGFAKTGFVLRKEGRNVPKPNAHFVDLTEGNLLARMDRLQSISQLYPHELMHVMFKMLSSQKGRKNHSFNVNMHYFSVITDYNTAFNEGFAEYMENISRLHESNNTLRDGISRQVKNSETFLKVHGQGFKRDIQWPLRLDYYKASMLVWYGQFEDYKRYVFARSDEETFVRPATGIKNLRDAIMLRNAGIENARLKKKNQVQCMASEGFVSTFLTHLAESELPGIYREPEFYKQFLEDTTVTPQPQKIFTPVENLFAKYFYVLHRHVSYEKSDRAQLLDFIEGYIHEFPDEAVTVLAVYKNLTGTEFSNQMPAPLWFLVKDYNHPVLVLDAFGAMTVPVYTFDINMAEAEDLMTIPGVSSTIAATILDHRNANGLFQSYEEVFALPGLTEEVRAILRNHIIDKKYLDSLDEEDLSVTALIVTPVKHLLTKSLGYFLIIMAFILSLHPRGASWGNKVVTVLKYFFLFLLFVVAGLASVIINGNTIGIFSAIALIYLIITFIILHKKKPVMIRNYLITGLMMMIVLYSII